MTVLDNLLASPDPVTLSGIADGAEGLVLADLMRLSNNGIPSCLFIARDGQRLEQVSKAIEFFAPNIEVLQLPAWDCLPYDRVSPNALTAARRMRTLFRIASDRDPDRGRIIVTTANAFVQRVSSRQIIAAESQAVSSGGRADMSGLIRWLETNGFQRASTVRDQGDFAVRGGILDLFAPGQTEPVRLDFFGDTVESIRSFDPENQRTTGRIDRLELVPMSEVLLNEETISRFRTAYVSAFGADTRHDLLYGAVSEGRRHPGLEHWLPMFNDSLHSLNEFVGDVPMVLDHLCEEAMAERLEQVADHYQARLDGLTRRRSDESPYNPIEPTALYLNGNELQQILKVGTRVHLTPFAHPDGARKAADIGGRQGRIFAAERAAGDINVFDAVVAHLAELGKGGRQAIVACWTEGSRDRLRQVLADHGLVATNAAATWQESLNAPAGQVPFVVLELESGFELENLAIVGEQDILGDRLVRRRRGGKRSADVLTEVTSLSEGDLVVHVDHGIGRFAGLETIQAAGAPHDCLEIVYHGGDKLYLPVENLDLLSRYGSADTDAQLDRLGSGGWQARKARMKERIREIADKLIKTAAARQLRNAPILAPPEGIYEEFAARFPYEETDDQMTAIDSVLADFAAGRPMDRLVCGDVGFGKTEVALRAAFITAMAGRQVAVVVPTTLLARQHDKTFRERFAGLPIEIGHISRLVSSKEAAQVRAGMADGTTDIAIGTHALLGKSIKFKDLSLLIVDEEQHFGVRHKERLKDLKSDVHVLTLTATPIPRTLQLALTGVRELSLIATAPVDRLAVRTFITPFDPLAVREALLRERYRGGQSFFVCPRISDLEEIREFLTEQVPELKVAVAHGQMAAGPLDDIMTAFYAGNYDVLLSTTIIESGLDIPTANTLIVHRADMFGLSQLYQLRGRVGRSKTRAYALFTVPENRRLTDNAERRLKVLQSLDTLGAGFQLASHDMDIRGAGNLLGDEQSGHIKEVGYELYQQMLEEAVAALKTGDDSELDEHWSPQISLGTPVMIPESYVADLPVRMGLYRRLAELTDAGQIDAFGAELIDRFGSLPNEVEYLLKIVFIKALCRQANVEKIDAGPKGIVIALRNNEFPNPSGLIRFINEEGKLARLRPDHRIVLSRDWPEDGQRLKGTAVIVAQLARLAGEDQPFV